MSLRIASFNIENLMTRFDFTGYRNQLKQDRVLKLFEIADEASYKRLEEARIVAMTDDGRQLSALALSEADADIVCLQEVESLAALQAFEYGYLFRMAGNGYSYKYLSDGNDGRGINIALMARPHTRDGAAIEILSVTSHAALTYQDLDLFEPALAPQQGPQDRIFRRDCLEVDVRVGGARLTLYIVHFKSMAGARGGLDGRASSMPVRRAEARAVRRLIENRFGADFTARKRFVICGDMNDYEERLQVSGNRLSGYRFEHRTEEDSALSVFSADGFAENAVRRRDPMDRWTLYHNRGEQEQHLCQLDYIWLSPALAAANPGRVPDIIRTGQPYRTPFPPGQAVERYPRIGWDRPKASDHCPVAITLDLA